MVRELGMLELSLGKDSPPHWHALIEISKETKITVSKLAHLLVLTPSSASRVVSTLVKSGLVTYSQGALDKREKFLELTRAGEREIVKIDEFSNAKIIGAFAHLSEEEQEQIVQSIEKYGSALEKSRVGKDEVNAKIHTLSTSRTLRKQVVALIDRIQKEEYSLSVTPDTNRCVLKAEEDFCYNHSCNFWYATDENGMVIGSIGLKKLGNDSAELKKFFVVKEFRGRGIAQSLMETLLKAARKHGFKTVYLGSLSQAKGAHKFYERSGFQRISRKDLPSKFITFPLDTTFYRKHIEQRLN
jgi:DNA-binding MarR family transcriptional regulator/N-acetylglutamate synthase-like GNAT family acetyltransferase